MADQSKSAIAPPPYEQFVQPSAPPLPPDMPLLRPASTGATASAGAPRALLALFRNGMQHP